MQQARPSSLQVSNARSSVLALAVGIALAPQVGAQTPAGAQLEEITVTATRRSQALSDVPISVSAIGDEELQQRGARQFDDIVRLTPGLNLTRQSFTGASQIAIRGISSNAGSGTTGIYIDDTPIQVRNMGFGAGNSFPGLFDIARVEVLRGPQGTLFGAGSEGGTVRFITTEPGLDAPSSTARAEMGSTENGEESYELGMAYGGPLSDRVALRGSAYFRHDGGFVDAVGGTYEIVDPTGESYGDSVNFTKTTTYEEDINWAETKSARLALKFAATDNLTITPSVFYQRSANNDGSPSYDLSMSNQGNADYSRQHYVQGAAGTLFTFPNTPHTTVLNEMTAPENARGEDEFTLTSLAIDWDLGWAELVSNTSYFDRDQFQWADYTKGYAQFYAPEFFLEPDGVTSTGTYLPEGMKGMSQYNNAQQNFVQEVRLQSTGDGKLQLGGGHLLLGPRAGSEPADQPQLDDQRDLDGLLSHGLRLRLLDGERRRAVRPRLHRAAELLRRQPARQRRHVLRRMGHPGRADCGLRAVRLRPHRHPHPDRGHPGQREQARFQRRLPGSGKQRQRPLRLSLRRPGRLHVRQRRVGALVPDLVHRAGPRRPIRRSSAFPGSRTTRTCSTRPPPRASGRPALRCACRRSATST